MFLRISMTSISNSKLIVFLIIPITLLFFIEGPKTVNLPFVLYAWNFGHVFYFFLLTLAIQGFRPAWLKQYLLRVAISIFLVSIAIETIQLTLGRSFSLIDIGRNMTGFSLAIIAIHKLKAQKLLALFGILFFLVDLSGFALAASLDWRIQTRSPVIEDFESEQFSKYWKGHFHLNEKNAHTGKYSAMFKLQPAKYAGASMHSILRNWEPYSNLSLAAFIESGNKTTVTVRINDIPHDLSNQDYDDRYNRRFELHPGWNEIVIPLSDIRSSPKARFMDMTQMSRIGIFISNLKEPTTLRLDNIMLTH